MRDYSTFIHLHSKKENKNSWYFHEFSLIQIITVIILFLIIAFFFVSLRLEHIQTEREIRLLLKQKKQLYLETLPLQLEIRILSKLDYVEETAKNKMGLREPKKIQLKKIVVK